MTKINIIMNYVKMSETPLRKIFAETGQNDLWQCVAETIQDVSEGTNIRWRLSALDNRPIKWAVIERTDNQIYLYFAKEQIEGSSPFPVPANALFEISDLSLMTDIYLGGKEAPNPISEYKGKVLGPLNAQEATAILTMLCLKNYEAELKRESQQIVRGLKL